MLRYILYIFFLLICLNNSLFSQVVINELSNGASGSQEYVELLVVGDNNCNSNCVDLRGWYLDDNNGSRSPSTSSSGIATGCLRFPDIAQWSCVKLGTMIVIYNSDDRNPKIPADDPTDADNDLVYIIPVSSTLIEKNIVAPSAATTIYPTTGFSGTVANPWQVVGLANGDDSFQVIKPDGSPLHFVSYGNNTLNPMIYYAGSGAGKVFYLNTFSTYSDPYQQGEWLQGTAPTNETPGKFNSAGDSSYVHSLRDFSHPLTATAISTDPTCVAGSNCNGSIDIAAQYGYGTTYIYTWDTLPVIYGSSLTNLCAGSYSVHIEDIRKCKFDTTIILNTPTAPQVIATANDTTICTGDAAILTASGATTYSWSTGSTSADISVSPATSTIYTVIGYSGSCSTTTTISISVSDYPIVATAENISMCLGNSTVLSATGALNYTWFSPAGVISTSSSSVTITPTVSGIYTYSVKGDNNGCKTSKDIIVEINEIPSVSVNTNSSAICSGHSVSLSASGASDYSWYPSTGLDVADEANVIASPVVTTQYTVTGINGVCTDDEIIDITVFASPTLSFTGSTDICSGQSALITLNGSPNYSWNPTTGLSNSATSNVTAQPTVTTLYTVTGYNSDCFVDTIIKITVDEPAIITTNGPFSFCEGGGAQLSASGALNYSWSPATGLSSANISNPTTTTSSSVIYTVIGSNACPGSADIKTISVTVFTPPVITPMPSQEGCTPFSPVFGINNSTGNTCIWELSNGTTINGCNNVSTTLTGESDIDVTLTITDANGCKSSALLNKYLIVHDAPHANFDYSPQPVTSFTPNIDLVNQSTGANNSYWYFETSETSTITNPSYSVKDTGTIDISLVVKNDYGCKDSISKNIPVLEEFVIYIPNTFTPNNDNLNDDFKVVGLGISKDDYEFTIFNRWGEDVFKANTIKAVWDGKIKNKNMAPEDVYVYKLKFKDLNGNSYTRKGHINVLK